MVNVTRCSLCGEPLAVGANACPICLEPRRTRLRIRPLSCLLLLLAFVASCSALVPVGIRIADPMTHRPVVDLPERPFPVVLVTGNTAHLLRLRDLRQIPEAPAGSSYLIPSGMDKAIEKQLNEQLSKHVEGGWVLRVRRLTPERQHIEFFWMNDGYSGGAYEATSSSITPRYRMTTGPGFAFVFGGVALLINIALWSIVAPTIWWWRHRK